MRDMVLNSRVKRVRVSNRVRVSTVASDRARNLLGKFPGLGSVGSIHRISALLSLRVNGYINERPDDIDSNPDRPARLPGPIEIYERRSGPLLFTTLVQLTAGHKLETEAIYEQTWYHIHLGSSLLEEIANQLDSLAELYGALMEYLPEGLADSPAVVVGGSSDEISIDLGKKVVDGENLYWPMNNTLVTDNPHAVVIGLSGQGKTQFVLDLLYQINDQSPETTFTILDYKGDLSEPNGEIRSMIENHLGCEVINVGSNPIRTVPFQRPSIHGVDQYALGVTDLLGKLYPRLGTQQRLALRQVISELLSADNNLSGFGFKTLDEYLRKFYEDQGRREDGLIEVVSRLNVLGVFDEIPSESNLAPLTSKSSLLRLSELVADSLPIAFLVINRLYDEMKSLPEATRQGDVVNLRHVIFIDEAHHYLSIPSSPLTSIIREGRSKGFAVLLATQSVSDLAGTSGADYREFLSNAFFFRTNIGSPSEIRALIPNAATRVQSVSNLISRLDRGRLLFNRHLQRNLDSSTINAVQFFRRQP